MRLYQLLLALALGGGVSYFAGSALPDTAGGVVGHLLTFGAASTLFGGLFIAYNKYGSAGCGCPGSRPSNPKQSVLPPEVKKQIDQMTGGDKKKDNCTSGTCSHTEAEHQPKPKPKKHTCKPDDKQVIGVRQFGSNFRNNGAEGQFVDVQTEPQEDGSLKVTVTTTGYTSKHFKDRLRPRLERIQNIKWQNPKNLGENKRQMEGVIAASANAPTVLAALEQVK